MDFAFLDINHVKSLSSTLYKKQSQYKYYSLKKHRNLITAAQLVLVFDVATLLLIESRAKALETVHLIALF